jgi:hypothetical protein
MQESDLLTELIGQEKTLKAERAWFVEEQNIRRALGPAAFQKLCALIQSECEHVNNVSLDRFLMDRTAMSLKIKDTRNARVLFLEYDENAACIHHTESGKPSGAIVFRVDKTPMPSLMPVHNGVPYIPGELAMALVIGLTRG